MTRLCGGERNYFATALILCTDQELRTFLLTHYLEPSVQCLLVIYVISIILSATPHVSLRENSKSTVLNWGCETDDKGLQGMCRIRFHSPAQAHLIKATQPFERLNVDFKGPLKSNNQNTYFPNIIDE